jgi:hypothetical protein
MVEPEKSHSPMRPLRDQRFARSNNAASMPLSASTLTSGTILIVGASRGLGLGIAAEFLARGWTVIGTARAGGRTELHDLADEQEGRLEIELLDINEPNEIAALRDRLSGQTRLSPSRRASRSSSTC